MMMTERCATLMRDELIIIIIIIIITALGKEAPRATNFKN